MNPYETDGVVAQHLDFHYGPRHIDVPNYAVQLVDIALKNTSLRGRALDIGCGTGRASFELARHFDTVIGMDYSARFIDVALALARGETCRYLIPEEGELMDYCQASLADADISADQTQRVSFVQGMPVT